MEHLQSDHVHILFETSPQTQLSKLINNYKTVTSRLLRKEFPDTLEPYISFEEQNQHGRKQTHDLRNWSFYDLETKLTYKANETGCHVIKVDPHCTSQRCPHCGTVLKENRNHDRHLYTCSHCGFTSNDDRVGAMNIYLLGTLWATGDESPSFKTVS